MKYYNKKGKGYYYLLIVLVLGGAHIIQVIQAGRLQQYDELGIHQDNLPRVLLLLLLYNTGG